MKKCREMIENKTHRDHLEYVEICKNIKKESERRYPEAQLRYVTIEASKSLKKVRITHIIMAWEVEAALRKMKNGREEGKDQVNIETLKAVDETIARQLAKLYTECIKERRIPKSWKEANIVIFFKKWNRKDIKNYRPFCMLSNMYKLFTKIITTRMEKKLGGNQAGFRSKYSKTDHIHAINQLKENCREYNIPLCIAFVDY